MTTGGFPHSDIPGSSPVYNSPGLFAVHHVLHRRNAPRHPPYTLLCLDSSSRVCALNPACVPTSEFSVLCFLVLLSRASLSCRHVKDLSRRLLAVCLSPNGDERVRTADPLLARQVLSHLSYAPLMRMGLPGIEPGTSRLSGVRSHQLSYRPILRVSRRDSTTSSLLSCASTYFPDRQEQARPLAAGSLERR